MGWFISFGFAVLFFLVLFNIGRWIKGSANRYIEAHSRNDDNVDVRMALEGSFQSVSDAKNWRVAGILVQISAVVIFLLWGGLHTAFTTIHQVQAGHVGVVRTFGDITGQTDAGLVIIWPWQSVQETSVKVESYENDDIAAFSRETQDVFIKATVNYSISPIAVQKLCKSPGCSVKDGVPIFIDILVKPRLLNFFKETTVNYSSVDIAPHREDIRIAVRDRLKQDLAPYSIDVADLLIDNIDFRQEFKDAIEAKQVATQEAQRQQQLIEARKAEAQQKIETARGDAESLKVNADGQAYANTTIGQSLTPALIQFQALQKLSDNVQIALIPSGQGVIIDPTTLLGGLQPTPAP